MAVQIGGKPDAGFDDPLGMLVDCHRRVERFLNILCRVAERAEGGALSADETAAVQSALKYFSESGPRHNSDEEDSLFPRLRAGEGKDVLPEVDRLEGEHHEGDALHKEIAELYTRWMAVGELHAADRERLRVVTARLEGIYREHIRIEEEVVFPRAMKVLGRDVVKAMGEEFKRRRAR
jgi:hemerythrin-like domain-containing protein